LYLTVTAFLHHSHDDALGAHEWKLLLDVALNHTRVNNQTRADVEQRRQNSISTQESLRYGNTPVNTELISKNIPINVYTYYLLLM
jgi:hypothetical protein